MVGAHFLLVWSKFNEPPQQFLPSVAQSHAQQLNIIESWEFSPLGNLSHSFQPRNSVTGNSF